MLRIMVERLQTRLILEVNSKRVIRSILIVPRTVVVPSPTGFSTGFGAVEGEGAHAEDFFGLGVDPEIDEVKLRASASARAESLCVTGAEGKGRRHRVLDVAGLREGSEKKDDSGQEVVE